MGRRVVAHEEDVRAVVRVRAGDPEAFAVLVERHGSAALRLAAYIAGRQEAPDVAQEAFLRAFRYLEGYDTERSFRTWLMRIVANAARSRAARRPGETPLSDEVLMDFADPSPGPFEHAVRRETRRAVTETMATLASYERTVLYLRHMEQMSYSEIAETLEWPLSLVRNRLMRARRHLAQRLERLDRSRESAQGRRPGWRRSYGTPQ